MKIDLSKNKKSGNDDKKDEKKGQPEETSKSPIVEMIEEKVPFVGVLLDRFSPKTLLIGAIIIIFIFVALVGRMFGGGEDEYIEDDEPIQQEEVVDDEADENENEGEEEPEEEPNEEAKEDEPEEYDEVVMEDVKANLINPDEDIEDPKESKKVVSNGLKHLESLAEENGTYQPKDNKAMGTTDIPVANDIILAIQAGYKADMKKSEWTQGSKDFIYQFVIPINSDDAPNGFLSGNYNTKNDDFQIVRLEGIDYSAIASPGEDGVGQGPTEEELKKAEEEREKKKNDK